MRKLLNWLVWGYSCSDIFGDTHSNAFDDSIFVIGKDSLQIYTNENGYKHLHLLVSLISNLSIYVLSKEDELNHERQEVIKVSKFYEFVHDKSVIGLSTQQPLDQSLQGQETRIIETWPIIQAYGLDSKFTIYNLCSCGEWVFHDETQVGQLARVTHYSLQRSRFVCAA